MNDNPYTLHNCKNRNEYLKELAIEHSVNVNDVKFLADFLGQQEDLDALPICLDELRAFNKRFSCDMQYQ